MSQDKNRHEAERWFQNRFYIPTRYPNGLPDLTPGQTYFEKDANEAIEHASFFLSFVRDYLIPPQPEGNDSSNTGL